MALSLVGDVLVRGPNWVGDLVMATPGFRALRAGLPEAKITLHVRPGLEALLAGSPFFDEVMPVASYHAGAVALAREAVSLRRRGGFDLGLCIPDSWSSALLMRAGGVRNIVGYEGGARRWLLHDPVEVPDSWGARRFVARELFVLGLIRHLGLQEQGTRLELSTTSDEEDEARSWLASRGVGDAEVVVALAPGASFGPSKHWPAESFAAVAEALSKKGLRVVIVGAASEAPIARRVLASMEGNAIDCVGALGLGGAKALLRRCGLVICNDAGARHIAVAFGVPCIVLFGPTSVEKTNLNLEGVEILETRDSCRPCYERKCPIDHRCMTGITPERVIARAERLLERAS